MKTILLTGGRGYIGSHTALQLVESGYKVIVIDDLSRSLPGNEIAGVEYHNIQMQDKDAVRKILSSNTIDYVMHFAAFISVEEWEEGRYWERDVPVIVRNVTDHWKALEHWTK